LNDECYAVIEDYTSVPSDTRATVKTVEKTRHYFIKRTSDNAVMVQFSLHGNFMYNNSTTYSILVNKADRSGIYAIGNCSAKNKKTGTVYSKTLKMEVSI